MRVSAFVIDMTVADVVEIFERTGQLEAVVCEVTPADREPAKRVEKERLGWSRAQAALPRLYPTVVGTTAGPPSPPPCSPPDPSV